MRSITQGDLCVNRSPVPLETEGTCVPSPALAAANRLLLARRAALKSAEKQADSTIKPTEVTQEPALPSHLGWGSAVLSAVIRPKSETPPLDPPEHPIEYERNIKEPAETGKTIPADLTLNVHPSLLTAILKQEQAAVGRVWLLARHLDTQGRGWLSIDDLRQQLTDKTSPLRICGWRRLRQILQQGEGIFWQRDDHHRLWLRSTVKVAIELEIERFSGSPVVLPLTTLLKPIGDVRAAFYASFHAGRDAQPISRQTLTDITGVSERAQRDYDARLKVKRVTNFVLSSSDTLAEDIYWEQGRAAFKFVDKCGKQGAPGQTYWAQRLPNSYHAPYRQLERRGTKSLNRQLKHDLAKHGTQGNEFERYPKLFYTDGKQAGRACGRQDVFLISEQSNSKRNFWFVLPGGR